MTTPIDDGALPAWCTMYHCGYPDIYLEIMDALNQRCDFIEMDRPTISWIQETPSSGPVTPEGQDDGSEYSPGVVSIATNMVKIFLEEIQQAVLTLQGSSSWCNSSGGAYSGYNLSYRDPSDREWWATIINAIKSSLADHRYQPITLSQFYRKKSTSTDEYNYPYDLSTLDDFPHPPNLIAESWLPWGVSGHGYTAETGFWHNANGYSYSRNGCHVQSGKNLLSYSSSYIGPDGLYPYGRYRREVVVDFSGANYYFTKSDITSTCGFEDPDAVPASIELRNGYDSTCHYWEDEGGGGWLHGSDWDQQLSDGDQFPLDARDVYGPDAFYDVDGGVAYIISMSGTQRTVVFYDPALPGPTEPPFQGYFHFGVKSIWYEDDYDFGRCYGTRVYNIALGYATKFVYHVPGSHKDPPDEVTLTISSTTSSPCTVTIEGEEDPWDISPEVTIYVDGSLQMTIPFATAQTKSVNVDVTLDHDFDIEIITTYTPASCPNGRWWTIDDSYGVCTGSISPWGITW